MSPDDNDSFIAMPPPGVPAASKPVDDAPDRPIDEDELIALPPGIVLDSGTFKMPVRTPPTREPAPEIRFVPTVIGAAPVLPAPPAEPVAEPAEEPVPPTMPVPLAAPTPGWSLELPGGGAAIALDTTVLIGRNPAASTDWPLATLLAVTDSTKSVSKTHALLEIDGGALWVHDLESTNGVYVVVGDEVVEVLPGTREQVPAGADLELGEFVLKVTRV